MTRANHDFAAYFLSHHMVMLHSQTRRSDGRWDQHPFGIRLLEGPEQLPCIHVSLLSCPSVIVQPQLLRVTEPEPRSHFHSFSRCLCIATPRHATSHHAAPRHTMPHHPRRTTPHVTLRRSEWRSKGCGTSFCKECECDITKSGCGCVINSVQVVLPCQFPVVPSVLHATSHINVVQTRGWESRGSTRLLGCRSDC
jgi:hypothetical protein